MEGIVHRYPDRVLLKANHACAVYCRFCFRRETVGPDAAHLSPEALAAAIRTAVTDRGMAQRADEVGRAIRAESGADHAAERIEHHVTRQRGT